MINTEIEGLIGNYIEMDSQYWRDVAKLKQYFKPAYVQIPQNSGVVLDKLSHWNRLLSTEYAKLNMMLTRRTAARI